MNERETKKYLRSIPLVQALWWFIENIPPESKHRNTLFFMLRERYMREHVLPPTKEV